MATIVLVRHAKAEMAAHNVADHDRAVTLEGRSSASRLAGALASEGIEPDLVIVSSALRTVQTWRLMAPAFDCERVQIQEELYETHVGGVQRMINALDSEISTVMFVGHEPTASATAAYLAGSGSDGPSLKAVALGLRTGTAAVLETDVSWADVGRGDARLVGVYSGRAEY